MLRNYLTIALRNLRKHKLYSFINVSGLALGMACCLLILTLIRHEWSYDRFHEHADRLYRTSIEYVEPDGEVSYQNMMFPDFTPALQQEYPAIEHATRFVTGTIDVQVENEFYRQQVGEVDPAFFQMFSFPLRAGNPENVLRDPNDMVITATVARTLFGLSEGQYGEALGQTVSITRSGNTHDFTVTGVAANPPNNSSLQFDVLISFENYDEIRLGGNN